MGRYKVCVYAICKNEAKNAEGWMRSMSEADEITVTDTGSSDGTQALLRKAGAKVFDESIVPWRFDRARNISLSHVPEDADICVCTDLDERFCPGWREKLESAWSSDSSMGNYIYNWNLSPDGKPYTQFVYFKVHCRHGYRWKYPAHECLEYVGTVPEKKTFIEGMELNHYPDTEKSRSSYLPLLELGRAEMPLDTRMSYYLGREYMYAGMWDKCIAELTRYLALPSAVWQEERSAAMRWIARSYGEKGEYVPAMQWYFRAAAECPFMRDAYIECAQMCIRLKDWPTAYCMAERALRIKEKSRSFVNAGYAWDYTPFDLAAIACYNIGLTEKSSEYARAALDMNPENERLKSNLEIINLRLSTLRP